MMWTLYEAFFQVGLFAFGGGLAALPLIREQVVVIHGWLDMATFTDLVTIAEMTPGPIALNASTFVGTRVGGLPGAVIATLGCITPSLIIVLILARIYQQWKDKPAFQGVLSGLRPAAVALIASAGLSIAILAFFGPGNAASLQNLDPVAAGCFVVALFVLRKWKTSPILVMISTGVVWAGINYLIK
ncbi:MAG: chromate transporter [Bacillota bacterium]|nr:chromate transporter [Bacillota bacterium]